MFVKSSNLKMYFVTFLLILSCTNVKMLNIFLDDGPCTGVCMDDFTGYSKICQRGCRFFLLIDSINDLNSNLTIHKCYSSCSEAYKNENENMSCVKGCNGVYKEKQLYPIYEIFQKGLVFDDVSNCSASKNSGFKVSPITVRTLTGNGFSNEDYYLCASLNCSSIIQLSFFSIVLVAVIICTIKVVVLMYQFKFTTLKYLVKVSVIEASYKPSVQKKGAQNQHLLNRPVNA